MTNALETSKYTINDLRERQALPLRYKLIMTEDRIKQWIEHFGEDKVYVSFSGGKDSTVLLDIVRKIYPRIPAVFSDTGLEYPEIRSFVKTFDNVIFLKPKLRFDEVLEQYGYPVISKEISHVVKDCLSAEKHGNYNSYARQKINGTYRDSKGNFSKFFNYAKYKFLLDAPFKISHRCCDVMKKLPIHAFEKQSGMVGITGIMAVESVLRQTTWLRQGCNAFENNRPVSMPLSFWTEQDIFQYIIENKLPIASVYGEVVPLGQASFDYGCEMKTPTYTTTGCKRTGCMFCMFGCHLEKAGDGRFEKMAVTHPKQYDYIMRPKEQNGLNFKAVIDWLNENGNLNIRY